LGPPHPGPKCQPPQTGPLCHVGTTCLFPCLLPGIANVCIGNKNNEATARAPIRESLRDIALTPLLRCESMPDGIFGKDNGSPLFLESVNATKPNHGWDPLLSPIMP
jgi:hypothetical protein